MTRAWWQLALMPLLATLALSALACGPALAATPGATRLLDSARTHERKGDLPGAVTDLGAAVALLPDWAPPRALLGKVYQLQAREQDARGQYQAYQFLGLLEDSAEQSNDLLLQIAEAEALLVYRINQERLERGLPALTPNADIARVARQHSREMRDMGYFSHTSPRAGYTTMVDRFKRIFGDQPKALAENLSRRGGCICAFTIDNIEDSHRRLMISAPHRRSILWGKVHQVGIGIAVNDRGDYWITETFASACDPAR